MTKAPDKLDPRTGKLARINPKTGNCWKLIIAGLIDRQRRCSPALKVNGMGCAETVVFATDPMRPMTDAILRSMSRTTCCVGMS